MANIRKKKTSSFTSFSNQLTQNNTLSFACRGMLVYVLSKPVDWECRPDDIERAGGIGKEARRRIMIEAEKAGYLTFNRTRNKTGQIVCWYDAHEEPVLETERTKSWEIPNGKHQPPAENPEAVASQPPAENPEAVNDQPPPVLPPADKPVDGSTASGKPADIINTEVQNTEYKKQRESELALVPPDGNPFNPESEPSAESELKAEKLFPIIHEGCTLPPKLDRKIEKRIYHCIDNLVLGEFEIAQVQAFIAEWRETKSIALTPERITSDIGEWRRLRKTTAAAASSLPPRPNVSGMKPAEEKRAMLEWFNQCQQIKQMGAAA